MLLQTGKNRRGTRRELKFDVRHLCDGMFFRHPEWRRYGGFTRPSQKLREPRCDIDTWGTHFTSLRSATLSSINSPDIQEKIYERMLRCAILLPERPAPVDLVDF